MEHVIVLTTETKSQSHEFILKTVADTRRTKQESHMIWFIILEGDFEISWWEMADSWSPQAEGVAALTGAEGSEGKAEQIMDSC